MAAPRPQPPKRNWWPVEMPGVTGRVQRIGLWVGSRPSQAGASIGRNLSAAAMISRMGDTPWMGDACSLVDAFRSGERTPAEELELVLAAIEGSRIDAVPFVDAEGARAAAAAADVAIPFGGVPTGVKELDNVEGWPATEASLVHADRIATST